MTLSLNEYISAFTEKKHQTSLSQFGRGIEREALRVLPEGRLSERGHSKLLGSALTHPNITTDYSETLMEFITPVSHKPETVIAQLEDVQKFTLSQLDGELLWPMSMPCFVDDDDKIPLAQFGKSNIGRMKTVYRQGLKNRYGSMMQVISGIHFNFSFPKSFFQSLQEIEQNTDALDDYISDKYFALLRNYKRFCWLIPYLYGSSPAICGSFLKNKPTALPFKKTGKGYLYLEHATSLRMSDLGYTNSEQSSLQICYNNLSGYLDGVKNAINLPSKKFEKIGIKVDGKYQQLNSNVLQIENELYAPVRPKCVAKAGEKPSEALRNRGVEYIEVRALDVNPLSATGITVEQVRFLDTFLTFCMLEPSPILDCNAQATSEENMGAVVVRGRDPTLLLRDISGENSEDKSVPQWGGEIFAKMADIATLLDKANDSELYSQVLATEAAKVNDASLTPSAQVLTAVVKENKSLTTLALNRAVDYREQLLASNYQEFNEAYFKTTVAESLQKQSAIEESDTVDFDTFLQEYFS
ncbi:glutamate--cysteine ligase [Cognaticolwellia beringensis]|uniref:Glutamate--cysteine ligase n=1 Tax=Cognaticolwellia beringensis TaxID=1967665 RepID=A0A222G3X9_9GAMM|nr:glutamate--cysteine ligase [Cognaticolwellia beringensis]ASP46481.1 glutamate--cysteine ligase [Cognaticolwellia beringensis]